MSGDRKRGFLRPEEDNTVAQPQKWGLPDYTSDVNKQAKETAFNYDPGWMPTVEEAIEDEESGYYLYSQLYLAQSEEEANEKIQEILDALGWEDEYFKISAINRSGTKELCYKLADFMENLPREEEEVAEEDKVNFMWDDYHKDAMAGKDVVTEDDDDWDDWDDEEDDGHVVYVRD